MKNSMRNIILSASCAASMAGVAAVPAVTEHAFVQDPQTRVAALTFTLGAESVVTLDVQTNGVSIGWRNFRGGITGCAFGRVNPAGTYRLEWMPWTTWADAPKTLPPGSVKAVVTA